LKAATFLSAAHFFDVCLLIRIASGRLMSDTRCMLCCVSFHLTIFICFCDTRAPSHIFSQACDRLLGPITRLQSRMDACTQTLIKLRSAFSSLLQHHILTLYIPVFGLRINFLIDSLDFDSFSVFCLPLFHRLSIILRTASCLAAPASSTAAFGRS
jgi:hypothetical protein